MTESFEGTSRHPSAAAGRSGDLAGQVVGRYHVETRVGAGGMGEVYLARDPLLNRQVALKRLSSTSVGDAENRRRLLHEGRALSSLSHTAIAGVYDVVETNDELFLVEEFVAGTSLRKLLARPIDPRTFLSIAEGCLAALEEAERHGIVHCDLKPENILVTGDGRPKILDFGLAQRPTRASDETWATHSFSSSKELFGGTTSYMAPEAISEGHVDARSDLFSLGTVFYEMLTGRHPFRRETPPATAASILKDDPDPPSHVNRRLPGELDRIVMGMLAKDPARRSGPAADLRAELRDTGRALRLLPPHRSPLFARVPRHIAMGTVALILLITGWGFHDQRAASAPPSPPVYVAVEPFRNLTAEPDVDYFAAGFLEAVEGRLGVLGGCYLVGADPDFEADARLSGEFQLAIDRIRINYELVDHARGPLVGGVLQGGVEDLPRLRDELADRLSSVLCGTYDLGVRAARPNSPEADPAAYSAYLQARGRLKHADNAAQLAEAAAAFEEAYRRDADFALATAGLAEALWREYEVTGDEATGARAEQTATIAVRNGPELAESHAVRGSILLGRGQPDVAAPEFRRALELDPRSDVASRGLGDALTRLGRSGEAQATLERAIAARPDDWKAHRNLAVHCQRLGDLEGAAHCVERVVALTPGNARYLSNLGGLYFYLGRNERAIDAYLESIAIQPNFRAFSNLATVYRAEGMLDEAATNFETALTLDESDYRVWGNLLGVYESLPGREADAQRVLTRAISLAEEQLLVTAHDGLLLVLLAQYYLANGQTRVAIESTERALLEAPGDMNVLLYATVVFEGVADRGRALDTVRRAMEAGLPLRMIEDESDLQELVVDPAFLAMVRDITPAEREGT